MKGYTLILTLDNVVPIIERKINIPEKITFQRLHEIIQILFGFENIHKYKFIFKDYSLEIQETGSINPDNVDASYELVDYYFKAYSNIDYLYNMDIGWKINIKIIRKHKVNKYPEIISSKCRYNPFEECLQVEHLSELIRFKKNGNEDDVEILDYLSNLKTFNRLKTQQKLMKLFDIDTKIVNHKLEIIKVNPNYSLDRYF